VKLRRLNDPGIQAFAAYLGNLANDPALPVPVQLLDDSAASEPLQTSAAVEARAFATRFAAAEYFHGVIAASGLAGIDRDRGLWTWLTLFYFDQLCPKDGHGKRKAGESARYVPNMDDARRFYRHLIYGPFAVYRLYQDKPQLLPVLLMNPLTVGTSETFRIFVENSELLAAPCAVDVANRLYYDPAKGKLRRGAGSKNDGGCRRLQDFINQITLTFDLQRLSADALLTMLPSEFKSFVTAYRQQASQLFATN